MILPGVWQRCTEDAAVEKIFFALNFHQINRSDKTWKTTAIISLA
jgi:hypothetical protein